MINQEFANSMFSIPQENHPEKLWVLKQLGDTTEKLVYDLGCGRNKTDESFIGVDVTDVTNLRASIDNLPSIPSSTVDFVISRHSLEHMLDIVKTLKEWRRILKSDGKMILILPDHGKIDTMDSVLSGGKHLHAFSVESANNLFSVIPGLKVDKIMPVVDGWSFGAVISLTPLEEDWAGVEFEEVDGYDLSKNQINGMMSPEELIWLYETAKTVDNALEIGSWMGRSTHALLSGCKGDVHSVDHYSGSADPIETGNRDVFHYFMQNVGHFPNLKFHKMASLEAAPLFADKSLDLVFIDGGHQYHEVIEDIKAWRPKAKKILAGHDFHAGPVRQAVEEMIGDVETCGTIWWKMVE